MRFRVMLLLLYVSLTACKPMNTRDVAPIDAPRVFTELADPPVSILSKIEETKDLSSIKTALDDASGRRVLLVLDIDDTLLTSESVFGSDAWFDWQYKLPETDPDKVPCLFDVSGLNYETGTQKTTQDGATEIVKNLKVDRLLLTSRGANYRAGTIRQLTKAEYVLPPPIGKPFHGEAWRWTDEQHPGKKTYSLSYDQGVYMTTGADKGRALLHLLERRGKSYEYVILVDDGRKNIENMQKALADEGIAYHGLWYTKISKDFDKQKGRDGWAAWVALMEAVYPKRLEHLRAGPCFN